jgi:malonate-semialdehyde dehydrogenase (acetylating) / methylmalonate-semialdehyde dehydrogenase
MSSLTDRRPPADTDTVAHWIAGHPSLGGTVRKPVFDPARGEVIREVLCADAATVATAVGAATLALQTWADVPVQRRAAALYRWANLIRTHVDDFAALLGDEHGKVKADAVGEVERGVEALEFSAGASTALTKGEFSDQAGTGIDVYSVRRPIGVCAAISPFNFPVMIPLWLSATALVCGNAVILKPSEQDPSCSTLLADLAQQAGISDGVFNVVQGDATSANALIDHPDVAAIGFVGSTEVAAQVTKRAHDNDKRVQAFGGAKNHMVVLPDADLDAVAEAVTAAAFGSSGQRCMAISVLVVDEPIAGACIEGVVRRASAVRLGPATSETSEMGPLISAAARKRVLGHIDKAEGDGARVIVDGRQVHVVEARHGFFVGPTVLDDVRTNMSIYEEEVFGPVLSVVRASGLDQAIQVVNSHRYGNGAALFTADGSAAREFARRVKAGMIGINVAIPVPVAHYSFGGWKDSRFADVHMAGPEAFRFFTNAQVVTSRWTRSVTDGPTLAFGSGNR